MKLPPIDLTYVSQRFEECGRDLVEACLDNDTRNTQVVVPEMVRGMLQLIVALRNLEAHRTNQNYQDDSQELKALGERGLQMLSELSHKAQALGLSDQARTLRDLSFPLALWLARQGGEFTTLQPVADAVAELANRISNPKELAALCGLIGELIDATMPMLDRSDEPGLSLPWRILVLNRAIVATRSHRTSLIESAYASVVELLPEDASDFFEEAMEQMGVVHYPEYVRSLVERHYRAHCGRRTLH